MKMEKKRVYFSLFFFFQQRFLPLKGKQL